MLLLLLKDELLVKKQQASQVGNVVGVVCSTRAIMAQPQLRKKPAPAKKKEAEAKKSDKKSDKKPQPVATKKPPGYVQMTLKACAPSSSLLDLIHESCR